MKSFNSFIRDKNLDFSGIIYNEDCLLGMNTLIPTASIDLVITDPPYGVGKTSWDNLDLEWLSEIKRVCKETASVYIFGSVWWYPIVHTKMIGLGFIPRNILCWFYENTMSRFTKNYQIDYDPIGFFTVSDKYVFNLDLIRIPYKSTDRVKYPIKKQGRIWKPNPLGKKRGNVIDIPALAGKKFANERTAHPTQKPLELIKLLVKASSDINAIVLDPFMGSGTTAVACKELGRRYIGFEINSEYCEIIGQRLRECDGSKNEV